MRTAFAIVVLSSLGTGCNSYSELSFAESSTVYELISESYIRGAGDTFGSGGRGAPGTTVCTYLNRETGQRDVRRFPGNMPCPPIN
ncbi:MAG: hypothetical protein AAGL69_14550 [Pseudomonadota bacterium]